MIKLEERVALIEDRKIPHNGRDTDSKVAEIIDYISLNDGPDSKGRAHPKKKVYYSELDKALKTIYDTRPDLRFLEVYYFRRVGGIWQGEGGKQRAREVIGRFIGALKEKNNWNLTDVIQYISYENINLPITPNNFKGDQQITAMRAVYDLYNNSISKAILDWVKHNPDKKIREGYAHIKPWHFKRTPQGIWQGERGKGNTRRLLDDIIPILMQRNNWKNLTEMIENISHKHFKEPFKVQTPEGKITYTVTGALREVYNSSTSEAILDWIKYNEDKKIREGYAHIKPWHFNKSPQGIFQREGGKENSMEVIRELVNYLMKKNSWTFSEAVSNISYKDVDEPTKIKTPDGELSCTTKRTIVYINHGSLRAAIQDFKDHYSIGPIIESLDQDRFVRDYVIEKCLGTDSEKFLPKLETTTNEIGRQKYGGAGYVYNLRKAIVFLFDRGANVVDLIREYGLIVKDNKLKNYEPKYVL